MLEIKWNIKRSDIKYVKNLIKDQAGSARVKSRKKNLTRSKSSIDEGVFWRSMAVARLTAQNPVGSGSRVDRLAKTTPFPLAYEIVCLKRRNLEDFIAETIRNAGIGKYKRSARDLTTNLRFLEEEKGWEQTLNEVNRLIEPITSIAATKKKEREVARYIAKMFQGFGPKQSRNLLQMLGLIRYETPIDSRVMKWLNKYILPGHAKLHSDMLADKEFYEFVLDGIQDLCEQAEIYPCIFDAAVFSAMGK